MDEHIFKSDTVNQTKKFYLRRLVTSGVCIPHLMQINFSALYLDLVNSVRDLHFLHLGFSALTRSLNERIERSPRRARARPYSSTFYFLQILKLNQVSLTKENYMPFLYR